MQAGRKGERGGREEEEEAAHLRHILGSRLDSRGCLTVRHVGNDLHGEGGGREEPLFGLKIGAVPAFH